MLSLFSPTVSSISNNLILFTTLKLIIYIYIGGFFFFFRNISVETNLNVGKKLKKYIKKIIFDCYIARFVTSKAWFMLFRITSYS